MVREEINEENSLEKQKWSNEKLHLENASPEDNKKLETSVAPAMPCKIMKNCGSGGSNKIKNKTCVYSRS